MNQDIRNN